MFPILQSAWTAIKTRTLFNAVPEDYRDAYRHSQIAKVTRQVSFFPIIMLFAQLLTFVSQAELNTLFVSSAFHRHEVFSAYSLFYCITAILSSRLVTVARDNLMTNSKRTETYTFMFLIIYTFLEAGNVAFEYLLKNTTYRFVGIVFLFALIPFHRRRNNVILLSVFTALSLFGNILVTITLHEHIIYATNPFLPTLVSAALAYIFIYIARNNGIIAFVNNHDMLEANARLEEANDKLNEMNDRLEQISTTDTLTKIANRRAFDDYIVHAWGLCQRSSQPITVLMMDIDHFKAYNDKFGHLEGDECLFRVAQCIKSHFNRAVDLFARYGGEEFVAILPFTKGESVMGLIEHIRSSVEAMKIPNPKSQSSPYVTISIGLATRVPVAGKQYDSIVSLSDDALYQAKRAGRNRVIANLTDMEVSFVAPRTPMIAVPGAGEDLEKLQTIVNMTMIAVFSVDLDTGKISFSKSILDFTGIESTELESYLSFTDYVHADDRPAFEREMQRLLSHDGELTSVSSVFRMRRANGLYNWVSMFCSYMHDETGDGEATIVAVGSMSDFSDQMRMQEITELMASGSSTYLYYYDFERREMFFNEPFREDFEIAQSIVANGGELFTSLIYEPEQFLFTNALNMLEIGEETAFTIEIRLISPTKGTRWVSMRGCVGQSANGRPGLLAGSILDTTEQVVTRQTNRLIIEGCSDCVYVYEKATDIVEFSSKIKEITTVPDLRIKDGIKFWTEMILPEDRYLFLDSVKEILAGQTDLHHLEYRVHSPTGEPIWLACRGKAAFNEQGEFIRLAGSIFNISAMGNYNTYIEELSMVDRLTNLPNRPSFYRDMNHHLQSGASGFVIMLDVDDFKNINSLYGLGVGDRMLTALGTLLMRSVPPDTTMYHMGSDLFLLHLKTNDTNYANSLAEQLCALSSCELIVDARSIRFTFSIGVVPYSFGNTVDEIVTNAEISNRKAKDAGKNRVVTFDPADKDDYLQRLALESRLRECVENDFEGFCAFYQPIFSAKTGAIVGAEALLRWRDSAGNVVPPNIVIPCLQNIGVFYTVESWILKCAATQCGQWLKQGIPDDFIININLSPVRAIAKNLLEEVKSIIYGAGLREHNVVLEITEESLIMEMQANIHVLRELQVNGILLAIDDFGTGYSSLSYLRDLPINEIKIDRSFIHDIEINPSSRDFVKSIILLSHSMGYTVCVEGAETESQVDILINLGADILQGYHFSRPLSAEEFEEIFLQPLIQSQGTAN